MLEIEEFDHLTAIKSNQSKNTDINLKFKILILNVSWLLEIWYQVAGFISYDDKRYAKRADIYASVSECVCVCVRVYSYVHVCVCVCVCVCVYIIFILIISMNLYQDKSFPRFFS